MTKHLRRPVRRHRYCMVLVGQCVRLKNVRALLLSTSKICFWPHFWRGLSNNFLLPHTGASKLKLEIVSGEALPFLWNNLNRTMCRSPIKLSLVSILLLKKWYYWQPGSQYDHTVPTHLLDARSDYQLGPEYEHTVAKKNLILGQ